jgi:hypothetical protein
MLSTSEKNGSIGALGSVWSIIEPVAAAGCENMTNTTARTSSIYMVVEVGVAA